MNCTSVKILGCKQQQTTLFTKQKGSSLQGSWGLEESIGSFRTRLGEWAKMWVCGGLGDSGWSQPAGAIYWDGTDSCLCKPFSRFKALVASIMGIWEGGWW